MKKRFKVLIGVSAFCTVAGLFATLVFTALNAFPELLDNELKDKEAINETFDITPTHYNVEAEKETVTYVSEGNGNGLATPNYNERDIVISNPASTRGNDRTIIETISVKEDANIIRGKEHLSGFYEYRNEVVVTKEKVAAINVTKEEDNNKILECTLLVLVIVQAVGFIVLQHKNKEPQIEYLENRENHQD